jgi:hypothetical protein
VRRRLPWVEPHQPRLDWQLWFAAQGPYYLNPWFGSLVAHLLLGTPPVLKLLRDNPFPSAPPRYVRALLYDYHFTDWAARRDSGAVWRRELIGTYMPSAAIRPAAPAGEPPAAESPGQM